MKSIFIIVIVFSVIAGILCFGEGNVSVDTITQVAATTEKTEEPSDKTKSEPSFVQDSEMRGIWLSYMEISSLVKGKTEEEYKNGVRAVFEDLEKGKINTVFYQCRAFCDSLYESDVFPVSKYINSENKKLSYDPFGVFLEISREYDVSVHCWVNPFRVSYEAGVEKLPENSPAFILYKMDRNNLILCENGVFLNPASPQSRQLALEGVREILSLYNVAGVHFDDYFYPETDDMGDEGLYKKYTSSGGTLSVENWRRENVSAFVGSVYSLVKQRNEKLLFGISPAADVKKCRDVFYADVESWCSQEGYVDYIIPQIYFGFENDTMPFLQVTKEWEKLVSDKSVRLICGLAPYKCGKIDENAGSGKKEWTENVNILSRQYEYISESLEWQGVSLFSYSYCFGENMNKISKKEIKNLIAMVE